jgi:hypothetical protein
MLDVEESTTKTRWRPKLPTKLWPGPAPGGDQGNGRRVRRADGDDRGTYDVRNTWQVVAGSVLIPLGVVFILLAWYGAAHAKVDQQQIPYLISGGFVGLGCMIVGGLLFWGHWLYRIYDQADLHHEAQQQLLRELIGALGANPAAAAAPSDASSDLAGETFFATSSGTVYHRAGCPVIAHHPTDLRLLSGPSGLRPCQICDLRSPGS